MSISKRPISLNWTVETLNKLERDWPMSGQTKNKYTEAIYIKGTRYDALVAENKRLMAEIKRLRGE